MILRAETPIRQEKKRHYDELTESVWHNIANLRAQYLGTLILYQKEMHYREFASAVRHNNITFESMILRARMLTKKKDITITLIELLGITMPTCEKRYLPQN